MDVSISFTRALFAILSVFFMTIYMTSGPEGVTTGNVILGVLLGAILMGGLVMFDIVFRRYNLRSFNTAIVGLFVGFLMGQALVLILNTILNVSRIPLHVTPQGIEMIRVALCIFGTYMGTIMTIRASNQFSVSIPFIKFESVTQKKKDLIIDHSILSDSRIVDICSTGIFDHHLVVPRFVMNDLYEDLESSDDNRKMEAKQALEVVHKLRDMPSLGLRFDRANFPQVKDFTVKLVRLARILDANVLTSDISQIQMASIEDVRIINVNSLSNSLKPLMETGENFQIKVQRIGKEPMQGVGYLDDGTMVVVNGGGGFIGATIPVNVLSVKHTSSGRIVFTNATSDTKEENPYAQLDNEGVTDA